MAQGVLVMALLVASGCATQTTPEYEARLRATIYRDCLEQVGQDYRRTRWVRYGNQLVDAADLCREISRNYQ